MELIKIGITETAPVPDSFGRAGGTCTLSFGSVWKSVDCGGRVPKSNYDFSALFENVVWGNTQIFLPISLVMIGGWLIDRESTHDTLKNIMTIPVSMPKMLEAKLLLVGMLAVLLGIYSVGITLITGLTVGLSGLTAEVFFMEVRRSC